MLGWHTHLTEEDELGLVAAVDFLFLLWLTDSTLGINFSACVWTRLMSKSWSTRVTNACLWVKASIIYGVFATFHSYSLLYWPLLLIFHIHVIIFVEKIEDGKVIKSVEYCKTKEINYRTEARHCVLLLCAGVLDEFQDCTSWCIQTHRGGNSIHSGAL